MRVIVARRGHLWVPEKVEVVVKVLLATDGGPEALDAARRAVTLLHPDAGLEIVTVIPEVEDPNEMAGGFEGALITEEEADERHREFQQLGESALDATRRAVGEPAEIEMVVSDDPGHRICELAIERGADVVVVGGTERGWFSRLLHASVMEHVVRHCEVPVLVVRRAEPDSED